MAGDGRLRQAASAQVIFVESGFPARGIGRDGYSFIHLNKIICMETKKKYYGIKGDKEFPSYMSEFFQAWPEKFEERKNMVKPAFYGLLAVVCVFIVIFPQIIPLLPLWFIRVAGVVGVLFFGIGAWMASSDTYNMESGGKVKSLNVKKFVRDEADAGKIVEAFVRHDFRYLTALPSGNNQPVQLHVWEDSLGKEFYCLLTTYTSSSNIVGLAEPVVLKGTEYEDNAELFYHMCDGEE